MNKFNRVKVVSEYWDEEIDCMPNGQLNEQKSLMMHKHLRYAYNNSLFYKRKFDKHGISPEKITRFEAFESQIPFTHHNEIITDQNLSPPFGSFLAMNMKHVVRIYASPGPLLMPFSKEDMDSYINTTANGLYTCGARRGDIVDITYAYQWDLAGTMLDDSFRRLGCAVVPGGPGMSETHIQVMKGLGVTILRAFPSFAFKLAKIAKQMGIDPAKDFKIRLLIIGGEMISRSEKEELSKIFGAEVREMYGWGETGFVAAECREGNGMHCFSDTIVEVIDPDTGNPVSRGERGEIVITDVSRRAMPLIRYRTGDITEGFDDSPCPCGRTSQRLKSIVGNTGKTFHIRGTHLSPNMIKEVVREYKEVEKVQILLEKGYYEERFTLKVELADACDSKNIGRSLKHKIRIVTRLKVAIEIVPKGSISELSPEFVDNRCLE